MSTKPFFTIITPTYNRASFLEEMIASVAAQTFQDYEHIIVDDGSTDGSLKVANDFCNTAVFLSHDSTCERKKCNKNNTLFKLIIHS